MNIHAVLVRTMYSSNIGSAARALANMGGDSLILIDPQCEVNSKARQAAAGAQEWLARRRTYKSWEEFYAHEGEGVRIGLSRRIGKDRKILPLRETLAALPQDENFRDHPHLYLFFGPEDNGLSADDLALMNFCCDLPVHGDFKSLNLSQAVLLTLFLARDFFPRAEEVKKEDRAEAPVMPTYFPEESIKKWLTAMGFDITARKASASLTLRRLFLHHNPTRHEVHVLEAVLQQNIRKLEDASKKT
jgi:TrmH family RNA methyltransferase